MRDKIKQDNHQNVEAKKPGHGSRLPSLDIPRTFVSLRNPVYRFYFASMSAHWSSMSMQTVARSLLIYRITGSGAILGLNSLANAIPMLLLSLLGGAIADRVQKKTVVQFSQLASAMITLGVTITLVTGYLGPKHPGSWWVLMVSAALQGSVMGLQLPSRQAIISEIVSDEHLMNAISLNNLGQNVLRLLAPALAGFLIDAFGFYVVYSLMTAMYLMAVICLIFVPATSGPPKVQKTSSLADITEGWRYVRREKTIFIVLIFSICAMILGLPYSQLLPMFTEGIFHVGATGLGILVSVSGVGAILSSLVIASLTTRKRGIIMLVGTMILSAALLGFAFSHWWYLSLFLIMFVGAGSTSQTALGNSLVQHYADASYRGRVLSFYIMGFGLGSIGTFIAGILAQEVGAPLAVGGMALILLVICLIILSTSPKLRKLD